MRGRGGDRQSRAQKRLGLDGGGEDEEGQRKTVAGQGKGCRAGTRGQIFCIN